MGEKEKIELSDIIEEIHKKDRILLSEIKSINPKFSELNKSLEDNIKSFVENSFEKHVKQQKKSETGREWFKLIIEFIALSAIVIQLCTFNENRQMSEEQAAINAVFHAQDREFIEAANKVKSLDSLNIAIKVYDPNYIHPKALALLYGNLEERSSLMDIPDDYSPEILTDKQAFIYQEHLKLMTYDIQMVCRTYEYISIIANRNVGNRYIIADGMCDEIQLVYNVLKGIPERYIRGVPLSNIKKFLASCN